MRKIKNCLLFMFMISAFSVLVAEADQKIIKKYQSNPQEQQLVKDDKYAPPQPLDFGRLSYTESFKELNTVLSKQYSFTEQYGIKWDELYNYFAPKISEAESKQSVELYYDSLREYIAALHSGHANIGIIKQEAPHTFAKSLAEINKSLGGSYGLQIVQLINGDYIVNYITKDGSAELAKIKLGAKILTWNSQKIQDAVSAKSIMWDTATILFSQPSEIALYSQNTGTFAGIRKEQERLIVRDALNSQVQVTFINPDSELIQTAILQAQDDNWRDYLLTADAYNDPDLQDPNRWITYKILPSGYGYIKVVQEEALDPKDPDHSRGVLLFNAALDELITKHGVPGIIFDIRHNSGGDDGLSAYMIGHFIQKNKFFIGIAKYNTLSGQIEKLDDWYIPPKQPYYFGKVILLTDLGTYCAAEGIAYALKNLPNVKIMSFDPNSGGSYADKNSIHMPNGFDIGYPFGRVTDEKGNTIIEANKAFQGGVKTDLVIPMTYENAINFYQRDLTLEYAQKYLDRWIKNAQTDSDSSNEIGVVNVNRNF